MGKVMKDLRARQLLGFDAKWWSSGIKKEKTPELLKGKNLTESLRAMGSLKT